MAERLAVVQVDTVVCGGVAGSDDKIKSAACQVWHSSWRRFDGLSYWCLQLGIPLLPPSGSRAAVQPHCVAGIQPLLGLAAHGILLPGVHS